MIRRFVDFSHRMDSPPQISVLQTAWQWWRYAAAYEGYFRATRRLFGVLWEFARDSTPERLRQRYGDADYDWDYRVNTTSGAVGWRDRLLGMFHSAYQPTEPAAFHEMLDALQQTPNPDQTTISTSATSLSSISAPARDARC